MPFIYGIMTTDVKNLPIYDDEDIILCLLDQDIIDYEGTLPNLPKKYRKPLLETLKRHKRVFEKENTMLENVDKAFQANELMDDS